MLTARQLLILKCIVEEFIETAEPVGSKTLMTKYQLPYSSATIRNEMSFLEEHGWLMDYRVTESRDIVDATIRNFQQYVQALVSGSGEEITQMYNVKLMEENSGTEISEEEIESMFESQEASEEGVDDEALSEEELIDMFKEISNTYEK